MLLTGKTAVVYALNQTAVDAHVAETMTADKLRDVAADGPSVADAQAMIAGMSVPGRTPSLRDGAETAAFPASDRASGITGSMTNVTAGLVLR